MLKVVDHKVIVVEENIVDDGNAVGGNLVVVVNWLKIIFPSLHSFIRMVLNSPLPKLDTVFEKPKSLKHL